MVIEDKVKALLEEKFLEEDYKDCFTIEVKQNNSKVQVFIDSDNELSLARCTKISRYLEAIIDEKGWLGPKYILEVSSPGASKPLVERQYKKHVGRKVSIELKDTEEIVEGELKEVSDDKLCVFYIEIHKEKKRKIKTEINRWIDFLYINKIKVIISF
jgi:ribosome maturation factor RimP